MSARSSEQIFSARKGKMDERFVSKLNLNIFCLKIYALSLSLPGDKSAGKLAKNINLDIAVTAEILASKKLGEIKFNKLSKRYGF